MGRLAVAFVLGLSFVACGGRTLEEPPTNANTSGVLLPDGGRSTVDIPTGGSGNPNATDMFDGTARLPECKLGFDPSKAPTGKLCPFWSNGRCYSTKLAACACACPNRSGTACVSDLFPDSHGNVLVTCS